MSVYQRRRSQLQIAQETLLARTNTPEPLGNGIYTRWRDPVVTADHVPLEWRYDFDPARNPFFMERLGINATFNAGALYWQGRYLLAVRVEGVDRKSFFALAESDNGVDGFRFHSQPIVIPETADPDVNVYDMRLVQHEDGYIYGLFCTERKDPNYPEDTSAAVAACGIVRSRDLADWERLPDLITQSGQQRNVVLHPEFVGGKYGLYTRGQDGFIEVGAGGGIGWGLTDSMAAPCIEEEVLVDPKVYHTVNELKNGLGPAPIKTDHGWLQLAHGVRNTAAGLRYVLYLFMTELDRPWVVTHRPAGHLLSPLGDERVGDVSNVVFSNGWIEAPDGTVYLYYASSDTRLHVATSSVAQLTDYVLHTPPDGLRSAESVRQRCELINANRQMQNHA